MVLAKILDGMPDRDWEASRREIDIVDSIFEVLACNFPYDSV
jgi:hypothetical protein